MHTGLRKKLASFLLLIILNQVLFPAYALALTSGASQPELQSFQPVGTTDMVDLFSGDFNYNIPLFELPGPDGGYPVNLFYNSVTSPEQEASFVGLGWNLGIGSITRQMRGLPDDFNGEMIERELDRKKDWTVGNGRSLGAELFGKTKKKKIGLDSIGITPSLGLQLGDVHMYNSFKGVGHTIDIGTSVSLGFKGSKNLGLSSGFSLSSSTFDGATANVNFGFKSTGEKFKNLGLGLDFSSREGGLIGASFSWGFGKESKRTKKNKEEVMVANGLSGSTNISFENTAYQPQISMPQKGINVAMSVKLGFMPAPFLLANAGLKFFYSERSLRQKQKRTPAFGAMYTQFQPEDAIGDLNREKDGIIRKGQKNLAIPSFTTDALSVVGHGVGGVYQLYRSDIPILSDQLEKESFGGGAVNAEFGFGVNGTGASTQIGVDVNVNWAKNETKRPFNKLGNIGAQGKTINKDFQPYFYKMVGEMNAESKSESDYMGNDKPVKLDLNNLNFGSQLRTQTGQVLPNIQGRSKRKPQTNSIQPITNRELLNNNISILPEYRIKYFDLSTQPNSITSYSNSNQASLDANRPKNDQIAGYTTQTPGGTRWVFGLPIMNKKQVEHVFSVRRPDSDCAKTVAIPTSSGKVNYKVLNTEEFFDKTTTPAFAHSYLMTAVLGADYVDTDPTDGEPNDKDLGYWVRVEYVKTSNAYKWRSPFAGALYIGGLSNKDGDDKATFSYGEREQFYPAKMYTKSHVAEFYYSKRDDGYGAQSMLQNFGDADIHGDASYKLDEIKIYSKKELELAAQESRTPVAMKTVHFGYNNAGGAYKLCPNTHNNIRYNATAPAANSGKLTLERVYFTYENNTRGAFSPYKFQYNGSNEAYSDMAMDRWGAFKPNGADPCQSIRNPFVDQTLADSVHNNRIKTWHLTDIYLPSGAKIHLDLGRDHYSHEQDRVAGQMFKIKGFGTNGSDQLHTGEVSNIANPAQRTIYFDLENGGISNSLSSAAQTEAINHYFEDLHQIGSSKQLFFQLNTDLLKRNDSRLYQDISGYADIQSFGIDTSSLQGGFYKRGFIVLKPFGLPIKNKLYHPFAVIAWQFIKFNLSDIMYGYVRDAVPTPASRFDQRAEASRFALHVANIRGLFKNIYKICSDRGYAKKQNLDRCFIRLNSPDKKMYGDGIRVQKVLLYENASEEETPVYGTVYDYEEEETKWDANTQTWVKTGRMISSGSATNTPSIGTQESSLRYAKYFIEELKFKQDMLETTEFPLNESYYPGASIGYRKVTAKSLATDYAIKRLNGQPLPSELPNNLPSGFATSGATIHEFYTCKDFPIITRETNLESNTNPMKVIPILIGTVATNIYTASQGYSIELNDMHGKPHRVSNYAQDKDGNVLPNPISWVEYQYKHRNEIYTESSSTRARKVIDNSVDVIVADQNPIDASKAHIIQNMEVGVDREFFMDIRETKHSSSQAGIEVNNDINISFLFGVPLPPFFITLPNLSTNTEIVRTAVTNKVIRRSGILTKMTAYDGQSRVVTENKLYDKFTGQPLLTVVNNNFDDPVYNYNIPGHFMYERMGAAYENWGLNFYGNLATDGCGYYTLALGDASVMSKLQEGDEYIALSIANNVRGRATLIAKLPNGSGGYTLKLALDTTLDSSEGIEFLVVRSGKRNHLTATVGNITALSDPTQNRLAQTCTSNLGTNATQTTTTVCQLPSRVPLLVDFLNAIVARKDSLSACIGSGGLVPITCSGTVAAAWAPLKTSFESCGNGAFSFTPYYPNLIKFADAAGNEILANSGSPKYLITIQSGYDVSNPSVIFNQATIDNILSTAFANNKIVSHAIKSCSGSPIHWNMSVYVREANGFVREYVVQVSEAYCFGSMGTNQSITTYQAGTNASTTFPYRTINNVLSISASTYQDNWDLNTSVCSSGTTQQGINTFQKGLRGIFRPHETWTYVADRYQSNTLKTRTDGVMDGVPIFEWKNAYVALCESFAKWKKTSTTLQYSGLNGEAIESKNIIDQRSAALYGYNGKLPIAVGANTGLKEFGYEGFEEYPVVSSVSSITTTESGNISFLSNNCQTLATKTFEVLDRFNPYTAPRIVLKTPYSGFNTAIPTKAVLAVKNGSGQAINTELNITNITSYSAGGNVYPIITFNTPISCLFPSVSALIAENWYTGLVTFYYNKPDYGSGSAAMGITDLFAHTGTKSLVVPANNVELVMQKQLNLVEGKQYVVSAWIYTGDKEKHSYENDFELMIQFFSITFKPAGAIIDGWQKVEGIFTALREQPLSAFHNKLNTPIYIDDIRIFPLNANMQTYVYDPVTYRVTEILDNNNYFARYKYDRQGTPISVQKETEKGVKTIQESGSYIKRTN